MLNRYFIIGGESYVNGKILGVILFFLFCTSSFRAQHYLIGDSQTFLIASQSLKTKLFKPLTKSGIGVVELNRMFDKVQKDISIKSIFVSIGVNDSYTDKGLEKLVANIVEKFPNAIIFVIKGSYGWGNVMNITNRSSNYVNYYRKFYNLGTNIIEPDIGFGDPHIHKYGYFTIAVNIDCIVWDIEGYKCVKNG